MNLGRLRARTLREWVVLLLLPVLALRRLVPVGLMPRFGDGLEIATQMCHGDDKSSIVVRVTGDMHGTPRAPQARQDAPGVFAAPAPVPPRPSIAGPARSELDPTTSTAVAPMKRSRAAPSQR